MTFFSKGRAMTLAARRDDLACRILKLEQQLKAYEQLHAGELAELWQGLEACKRAVADDLASDQARGSEEAVDGHATPGSAEGVVAPD
jgi:hypothetical protein